MKYILSFVSLLFWIIFYFFYILNSSNNIFWHDIINNFALLGFMPNLIIYPIIFLFLSLFFYINFSNKIKEKINAKDNYIKILFFIIIILSFLLKDIIFNNFVLFLGIYFFIFSNFIYAFLFNTKKYLKKIRAIWIISNYLSIILIIIYWFTKQINIFIFIILIYWIFFNFDINKRFSNLISLIFSILSLVLAIYFIFILIYDLYINYTNMLF